MRKVTQMPYTAVDIVNRMDATVFNARAEPTAQGILARLAIVLTLIEVAVLWAATSVLT